MPRRYIDYQPADGTSLLLAADKSLGNGIIAEAYRHGFQVLADGVDMPVRHVCRTGLDNRPRLRNKLTEVTAGFFALDFKQRTTQVKRSQPGY